MTAVDEVQITEPGVYDLPDDVYHADPVPGGSLAASGALQLIPPSCPAKFAHERANGRTVHKKAWDLGHAAHKILLGIGPELVLIDRERWDTKAVKEEVAAVRERGGVPLKRSEYAAAQEMVAALRAHPFAGKLFDPERADPERSLFWRDDRSGITRRCRLDALPRRTSRRMVVPDYKTAAAADQDSIERALYDYGYHFKAAWYLDGVRALDLAGDDAVFVLVVQEKEPPYLVNVVEVDALALRVGRHEARRAIDTYVECTRTGRWPGYADDVELVGLPPWVVRRYEGELSSW